MKHSDLTLAYPSLASTYPTLLFSAGVSGSSDVPKMVERFFLADNVAWMLQWAGYRLAFHYASQEAPKSICVAVESGDAAFPYFGVAIDRSNLAKCTTLEQIDRALAEAVDALEPFKSYEECVDYLVRFVSPTEIGFFRALNEWESRKKGVYDKRFSSTFALPGRTKAYRSRRPVLTFM